MEHQKTSIEELKSLLEKVLTVTYQDNAFTSRTGEALKYDEKENGTKVLYIQNEDGEVWGLTNNSSVKREIYVFPVAEAVVWKLATENKRNTKGV